MSALSRLFVAVLVVSGLTVDAAEQSVENAVQSYQERGGRVVRARRFPANRSRSSISIGSLLRIETSSRSRR